MPKMLAANQLGQCPLIRVIVGAHCPDHPSSLLLYPAVTPLVHLLDFAEVLGHQVRLQRIGTAARDADRRPTLAQWIEIVDSVVCLRLADPRVLPFVRRGAVHCSIVGPW